MNIFPAIDLYGGKAVRLLKGDYNQITVYSDSPLSVAKDFAAKGAKFIHLVDLEGARDGNTPNLGTVENIVKNTDLFSEIGGGIRDMQTVEKYLSVGVDRVILGTAAVTDRAFLEKAIATHGEKIAVGVDIRDGFVAIKGWTELSSLTLHEFCRDLEALGVRTLICTDISRDGNMRGTNRALYKEMSERYQMQIVASGGVSTLDDVRALSELSLYGAIIGKAYYTGAIDLGQAIEVAK